VSDEKVLGKNKVTLESVREIPLEGPAPSSFKLDLSKCSVFFDFDNTITSFDILDDIIQRFSINDDWLALEKDWIDGKIGSRECLAGQLKSVRMTKQALVEYLSGIEVDHFFHRLLGLLKKAGVQPVIVSDSFSFIIRAILQNNGIYGIQIHSNRLRFSKDRLIPMFAHTNQECKDCANCKKMHLIKLAKKNKRNIYIGDGLSDVCPAGYADVVFAKGTLWERFKDKKHPCVKFRHLGDVYQFFKEGCRGTEA
jgi:2-hydroxy-3-keto-5-methylthiopentenyl-1-phosphate phosphatase